MIVLASNSLADGAAALWSALGRASLDGAIFIGLVWAVCLLIPRMPATLRTGLWWLAGLKLLVGFVWVTPLVLPVLPPRQAAVVYTETEIALPASVSGAELPMKASPPPVSTPRDLPWREGLLFLWLGGVAVLITRAGRDLQRTRRICRRAEPVADPRLDGIFGGLARQMGIANAELRMSREIEGPHVLGLTRPIVVVPDRDIGRLTDSEWEMVLAHELMHLRRGDLGFGWIPFMAERLFFFHPLVTLAAREYRLAREAACDAAVVQTLNASPRSYGQLLLTLSAPGREIGAAAIGATSAHRALKRRLGMLQQAADRKRFPRVLAWLVAIVALAGLVPIQLAARGVETRSEKADVVVAPVESSETTLADILVSADPARIGSGTPVAASDDPIEPTQVTPDAADDEDETVGESGTKVIVPELTATIQATQSLSASVTRLVGKSLELPVLVKGDRPVGILLDLAGQEAVEAARRIRVEPSEPGTVEWTWSSDVEPEDAHDPDVDHDPDVEAEHEAEHRENHAHDDGHFKWNQGSRGYTYLHADQDFYVLMKGNGNATMSGSSKDLKLAKKLHRKYRTDFLLFKRDGKVYATRDNGIVRAADRVFEPQRRLGRQQGELGSKQGELGEQQGRLGKRQGRLGAQQGELGAMSAELALIQAEISMLRGTRKLSEQDRRDLERRTRELARRIDRLSSRQSELGSRQAELGAEQAKLGQRQAALGAKQAELGRQQAEASRVARVKLQELIDRALRENKAEIIRD